MNIMILLKKDVKIAQNIVSLALIMISVHNVMKFFMFLMMENAVEDVLLVKFWGLILKIFLIFGLETLIR